MLLPHFTLMREMKNDKFQIKNGKVEPQINHENIAESI